MTYVAVLIVWSADQRLPSGTPPPTNSSRSVFKFHLSFALYGEALVTLLTAACRSMSSLFMPDSPSSFTATPSLQVQNE
jgi:hypothetical protein